jgi:hypothetical protein
VTTPNRRKSYILPSAVSISTECLQWVKRRHQVNGGGVVSCKFLIVSIMASQTTFPSRPPLSKGIVRMAGAAQSGIQPGQWFQQNRVVWEVVDFKSFNDIPHVQIMKVGDPTERKLISASSLRDGYDLLPENEPELVER